MSPEARVEIHASRPAPALQALEIDVSAPVPVAYAGLRRLLAVLADEVPAAASAIAAEHPWEWGQLVPSGRSDKHISDIALSPSERRLHRESEQVFRVLNVAARFVVDASRSLGRPLLLRNTGATDLLTLRGLMRAAEWARLVGAPLELHLADWSARRDAVSDLTARGRTAALDHIAVRLRATVRSESGTEPHPLVTDGGAVDGDAEDRFLRLALDEDGGGADRIAACLLAIRSAFFTTNYEGSALAAQTGLRLLDRGAGIPSDAIIASFRARQLAEAPPSVEIDVDDMVTPQRLRTTLLRSIAVVQSYMGDFHDSLETFGRALAVAEGDPVAEAQIRMYRALQLGKRLGRHGEAREEIVAGLAGLEGIASDEAALEQGWLRNVYALTFFAEGQLREAYEQERLAIKAVARLHDTEAAHLKINLISNLSVLHETAKEYDIALQLWTRFAEISSRWGDIFFKHHHYREAGLRLKRGEHELAVQGYERSYELATGLHDPFHQAKIAGELGRYHLESGRKSEGAEWYRRAYASAQRFGCPMVIANTVAGLELAGEPTAGVDLAQVLAATSTFPKEAARLAGALQTDREAALRLLPKPGTKLNAPFDVVNVTI